jgi:hypothetical protein
MAGKIAGNIIELIKKGYGETLIKEIKSEREHSIYTWFLLSLFPWNTAKVKEIKLDNADIYYLIMPKWNQSYPPVNGFIKSQYF